MGVSNRIELFNVGLYTATEVGTLLGISRQRASRWLFGQSSYHGLLRPTLSQYGKIATFRELIELLAVRQFLKAGLSLQKLRAVKHNLSQQYGQNFPFSSGELMTDGREVFVNRTESAPFEVFGGQYQFYDCIKQSLVDIDYDPEPKKWWIAGRGNGIVVDPKRSFGAPIDDATGVPTARLHGVWIARHKSYDAVSDEFLVSVDTIKRACAFQSQLVA